MIRILIIKIRSIIFFIKSVIMQGSDENFDI